MEGGREGEMGISSRPCTAAGIGLNSTAEKEKRQSIIRQRHTAQDKYNGRRRVRWTDLPSLPPSRHHNHPTTEVDDEKQTDNPQKPTTLLPSSNAVSSFDGMDQEEGGYALARRVGRNHLSPSSLLSSSANPKELTSSSVTGRYFSTHGNRPGNDPLSVCMGVAEEEAAEEAAAAILCL